MAKQLNYSVSFTPDTTALQQTMNTLQKQLQSIASTKITIDDGSMRQAVDAAKDLQKYLLLATDATTGNLDLSKFSSVLKNAGTNVTELSTKLMGIGPQGNQAFMTLARGVSQAQIPLKKTNKMMDELWTTMKNTMRWQLTSSAMHGLMGAMQKAVGYAKDLNKSLTDIQIVSEKSSKSMDEFAVKANKAAKRLSTTTTDYTDAALIYYQQGLNDTQVTERTDVTVKMANVVGESATEVSSYMTAIWNNFDNGSKSLEYYGDVMAKLGAETAASSAEIAEGLEKFASIGETVGLSYEYAASAVATVVDKTRQSADTVGTAFKTIFARIQGLNLGETLDDGTTLNKYSEALEKVGINIKDQFGNLKDTDVILDEMGAKWKVLSKDQQMALAQTVAGTRQYTQLMSLMNNYDDFKVNVDIAENSEGTLDAQAEIYAQSWEAASKRAQASMEDIYDSIINDDAIIGLVDTVSHVTDAIAEAIDGFGGFGSILTMVGSIFVNKFSGKIVSEIGRLKDNFNVFTGKAKKDMMSLQTQMSQELGMRKEGASASEGAEMDSIANLIAAKQKLAMISEDLNDTERQYAEYQVSVVEGLAKKVALLSQEAQKKEQTSQSKEEAMRTEVVTTAGDMAQEEGKSKYNARQDQGKAFDKYTASLKKAVQEEVKANKTLKQFNDAMAVNEQKLKKDAKAVDGLKSSLKDQIKELQKTTKGTKEYAKVADELESALATLETPDLTPEEFMGAAENMRIALEVLSQEAQEAARNMASVDGDGADASGLGANQIKELAAAYRDEAVAVGEVEDALEEQEGASKNLDMSHAVTGTERVLSMASAMGSLYSVYSAVSSLGSIWADEDATTGEKIMSTMMTMSTLIPTVITLYEALDKVMKKNIGSKTATAVADGAVAAGTAGVTAAKAGETAAVVANTAAWFSNPITAIIAVALLAVVAVIGAVSAGIKANTEKLQENSEAATEAARAAREESEANREKLSTYNELLDVYQKTGEGKAELDAAAQSLAEAYDLEGAALAKLTGKYEDYKNISKAAYEEQKKELEGLLKKEDDARVAAGQALKDTAKNADIDGNGSFFHDDGSFGLVLDGYGNEKAEQKVLESIMGDQGKANDKNDYEIKVGQNPEDIVKLYDQLSEAKVELIKAAEAGEFDIDDSGTYEDLSKWLDEMEEDVETYREHMEEVERIKAELGQFTDAEGNALDLSSQVDAINDVTTLEEYQKWVANLTKSMTDAGMSTDEIAEKINTLTENSFNPAIESLKAMDKAFDELESIQGIDKEAAQSYYNALGEDQELFWSINFDTAKTEEAWNKQIETLKAKAEMEEIQVKIDSVESAQGSLKEDMTAEDYDKIKDSGIDWGNAEEGIIKYSDFVRMTYTEQSKYLEELNDKYKEQSIQAAEAAKEAALNQVETCESAIADLETELENTTDENRKIEIMTEISNYEAEKKDLLDDIDEIDADIEIEVKLQRDEEFKELLNDLESIKGINDDLVKDVKKVGANYQLTAEQAREWTNVYPDILKNATVTKEGIVQLNAEEADAFIKAREAELIAAGEAEIAELEMEKAGLEAKKARAEAEIELANAVANGEVELTAEQFAWKVNASNALTEALINNGISEVDANKLAMAAMAGNQEEYDRIVAEVTANMDENMREAATAAMQNVYTSMQSAGGDVADFAATCHEAAKAFAGIGDGEVAGSATNQVGGGAGSANFDAKINYASGSFDGSDYNYEMQEMSLADFIANKKLEVEGFDAAIGEINTRIAEIRAGMASSLNSYTPETQRSSDAYGDNGSGGSDKDAEDLLEDVAERYHEINREIEYYNHLLDENSKKKERAFGKDKLKLMKEEQKLLEEKYKREKDLFDLQTAFLAVDQANIEDAFTGAQFDKESGELTNYTALMQQATDKLNAAKTAYNNGPQEDADKDALDAAQDEYDKQMALLEQYEETLDEWRTQKLELQDLANQIYDAKLEELDYKLNLQIEFSDDELAYLEYLLERIENKAFSAADAIANLGYQTQAYFNKNEAYESGIKGIFGNHGLTDDDFNKWMQGDQATIEKIGGMSFTEDEVAKLREYRDGLMETNQALIETRQAVHDNLLKTFEEANEKIDDGIEKLEHYQAVTESYKNIVDLVGKANFKDSDKAIKALNESTINQAKNVANATIVKRDMIQAELDAARAAYEQQKNKISEEERKMWEDSISEMEKSLMEAEEAAMSSVEEWIQAVNDKFISEIEQTMDKFSETVAGKFKNLTELQEAFERGRSMTEMYLEDYEKIYEFSKLNRDIEKSIDQTDNVRAKKELLALQEEINELEESGAEVSEYQMENLRKRYELKLAELALDEAKNAKSQVRMTMDNEGNWGYVYTADDEQVEAAEQAYEDKLFELQQQNAEYINQLQEDIINMQIEMKDKLAEIAQDESLSIEERQAKMAEVQAYYQEKMNNYASELGIVLDNNKQLYTEDWTAYAAKTDYKISDDERYVDSFQETDLAILTGFENMADYQQNFNDASGELLVDSNQAFDDWEDEVDEALDAAGLDMDDLADDIEEDLTEIDNKSDETAQAIEEDSEEMVESFQEVVDAIIDWEDQYSESVQNMIDDSDLLIEKFNEVLALWAEVKTAASEDLPTPAPDSGDSDPTDGNATTPSSGNPSSGNTNDGMPPDNSSKAEGVAAAIWMDGGATSGWYNGSDRSSRLAAKGVTAAQAYINAHGPNGDIYRSWVSRRSQLKNYYYGAFDTGGYTGEWGPDGKFAMLHEKELVLNKEDTGNILSAVNMIREISNMIDLNAMSASHGLTSLLGVGGIKDTSNKLEQTVTIHAEFPSVQNHSEIEEAFNNLINTASQYANRKL